MELANDIFLLEQFRAGEITTAPTSDLFLKSANEDELLKKILDRVKQDAMAPLYLQLVEKFALTLDETLLSDMRKANEASLAEIEVKIEDAQKNAGDTEVIEGLFLKARHLGTIGETAQAIAVYEDILQRPKTVTGKKIDACMDVSRLHLFSGDSAKLKTSVAEAKRLNELGGDWDRRNRLKVYEAMLLLLQRDTRGAAQLLLDCVATFSCTELLTYKEFMFYAVVLNVISLSRTDLSAKIVKEPSVITEMRTLPQCKAVVQGIYNCNYKAFFESILLILPDIQQSRFLHPLTTFIIREMRVLAYSQFLEAYKSVHLSSMAASFGISVSLLDAELSRFIAAGRLSAKIDKVGDLVETRRPDKQNAQYHEVVKKGDALLNQVQKLVRAINV